MCLSEFFLPRLLHYYYVLPHSLKSMQERMATVLGVQAYTVTVTTSVDLRVNQSQFAPGFWQINWIPSNQVIPQAAYCLPPLDHISHWRQVEAWKTHCMELVTLWKHNSSFGGLRTSLVALRSSLGGIGHLRTSLVVTVVCVFAVWWCQSTTDTRTTPRSACGGHMQVWWSFGHCGSEVSWLGGLRLRLVWVRI